MYDFLLVGSGLFSCVFARMALDNNLKCLIIDKRDHPFGNCYTKEQDNIHVHMYGPHIFHTNNLDIWTFINRFAKFNTFINKPKVKYQNKLYSFPINLMTLYQIWGVTTPEEASQKLDSVKLKIDNPQNLEEWALSQVGEELYQIFIYGYTKKQWNTEPKNLPSFIIKRLPIRLYFDENYFFDQYQGIPIGGYSQMMQNMIEDTKIILNEDYTKNREYWNQKAKNIVYTGAIDEYFEYICGKLDYRSLKFEHNKFDKLDFQGNAIINYTEYSVPYTRVIEHKYFDFNKQDNTIVSYEYPANFQETNIPYYPINNKENTIIYNEYKKLHLNSNIIFGGRLAEYRYYDMHQIIGSSIHKFQEILK
jgi:UDP-galactopyranose mutase